MSLTVVQPAEIYGGPFGLIPEGREWGYTLDCLKHGWLATCLEDLENLYQGRPTPVDIEGTPGVLTGDENNNYTVRSILVIDRTRPSTQLVQHDEAASLIFPKDVRDDRVFGESHKFNMRTRSHVVSGDRLTVKPLQQRHLNMFSSLITSSFSSL